MKRTWYVVAALALAGLALAALVLVGRRRGAQEDAGEFSFDFEEGEQGWEAGFADLPADHDPELYELDSSWEPLPSGLEGHGIYIQGHNRSDDLFMFLKVQVDGLEPNTAYEATFALDLATAIPGGMMGIGGSPGESVYVKAGATAIEPSVEEDVQGWLRMNIDIGSQSQGGEDMIVLGNVAYEPEGSEEAGQWVIKPLDSGGQSFSVTSDDDGALWLIVGTDSGFEGLTALYYGRITASLTVKGSE